MKKTKFLILLLATSLIAATSCKNSGEANQDSDTTLEQKTTTKQDEELQALFALMQGEFNSAKQATRDSSYYDISLKMVQIWQDKGHYLYVEQAVSTTPNEPYRQRVYQLTRTKDDLLGSSVYEIPNDSLWIGKWKTPAAFNSISPDDLTPRQGCTVYLKSTADGGFEGSTREMSCLSSLRGAAYATSIVKVYADRIESWDQGFDAEGNQVWGAEKGGYIFDRID